MNFFENQDHARRKTGRLIVLFVIAVIMILISVNVAAIFISAIASKRADVDPLLVCSAATIGTLILIIGGSLYKTAMLAHGGGIAVASQMGGVPINPAGSDRERMLQNVVEEMSIASGVPVPRIYIMPAENAINAFAAGFTPADAVVCVTAGTLAQLNRDELQGVIAHEFSHILNGDMRLNLRLIGILHGILLIAMTGYIIIRMFSGDGYYYGGYRSSRRSRDDKDRGGAIIAIFLAAIAMIVIGGIGVFFGRLIQAAVSRQREYLADASAVQFTRNPMGLVGALKKIGQFSSQVHDGHAMGAAHLFFGSISRPGWANLMATHPPLRDRIKAIDPTFDGTFSLGEGSTQVLDELPPAFRGDALASMLTGAIGSPKSQLDRAQVIASAGRVEPQQLRFAAGLLDAIPANLVELAREPFSARAIVFALLVQSDADTRRRQLGLVQSNVEPTCYEQLIKLIDPISSLPEGIRLPLLDITWPSLRQLSPQQATKFRAIVRAMIEADGRVSLFEYALNRLIEKQLSVGVVQAREPMQYFAVSAIKAEAAVILSALASASTADTQKAFTLGATDLDEQSPPAMVKVDGLEPIEAALRKLSRCSPAVKQRLIRAFAATVTADGEVNVAETELLRAVAATLDVPLPPMRPGMGRTA